MRSDAHLEFTVTIRTQPLTLIPKAPNRSEWRGAPGRTKEAAVGPSRQVPAPSWPSRPHAQHSSPHPRPVQLLLLDQ